MTPSDSIYFDIAAVIIMAITLLSLVLRHVTKGATNRVYLSCMSLVTVMALACLLGELYDASLLPGIAQTVITDQGQPPAMRDVLNLVYYSLRSLTAPMYLVLIATVSGTTHRLNSNNVRRVLLWVPMITALVVTFTNPFHHLVYHYVQGVPQFGPLIWVLYGITAYYSIVGVCWLIRWRQLLTNIEFVTLMVVYLIVFTTLAVEYAIPSFHADMFITSIAMMLLSAFVIRPEKRLDSLVNAASLPAYREMCERAFLSNKRLCLVYLEIVNLERLRELVGKDELQNIVRGVSANLSSRLERDDTLYYLRTGSFCIVPRNLDVDHALDIAWQAHSEGRAKSIGREEWSTQPELRTCIVRVPEDVPDNDTLKAFVRRFSHLAPESCVTTFEELSKQENFNLEMALSDIVANAIDERSFTVHYQPIWSLTENRFRSAEALVRLYDPTFGHIPPTMFIPEAEQNGLIDDIGAIMLEKICAFLGSVDYEATGLDYVEANLSVEQCIRPELAGNLLELMRTHGVEPRRLNLELTETATLFSKEVIATNVHELATAGVTFSLDDYGTGYSNATRMLSLPFSLVKLDKSFVDNLSDPAVRTVLAGTVTMLKSIGKRVLIEGVETHEQAEVLAEMGVDYIQGYYYAKPMPEDEFLAFLKEHNHA